MTFDEFINHPDNNYHLLSEETIKLLRHTWRTAATHAQDGRGAEPVAEIVSGYSGDPDTLGDKEIRKLDLSSCRIGDKLYTHSQPAQQGSVPEGWSLTHIDDPATDGYLVKGPGISYCAWKDKEPWLYLFCEALASTAPQPEGDGQVRCHMETATIALEALEFYARKRFKGFGDDPEPYEHHLAQQAISELQGLVPQPPAQGEGDE